jgi:citrate lyase subunit beta/citryl-CoA lyase
VTPLTALYVPGSRPDRFDKAAAAAGADVVILDLEDSVAAADKDRARAAVCGWLASARVPVQVRVNAPGSEALARDLDALPVDVDIRLPKVEGLSDLSPVAGRRVHAIIESALGVERAFEIASHADVATVALGEADLAATMGLEGEDAFAWIRSRLVVAALAAGLPAPMMSVYADVPDLDGLATSCAAGRRLGLRGRTAVHPRQLPVIRTAFASTPEETAWAAKVLAALDGTGVASLPDGSMVDAAMARRALAILSKE